MNSNEPKPDFAQRTSRSFDPLAKPGNLEYSKIQEMVYELRVRDAMNCNVITTSPGVKMNELGEILRANRISGTPVMEGDKLVGVISIEDFIIWLDGEKQECTIGKKMTTSVETLFADEPLIHAVGKLEKTGYGRLPIIDRHRDTLVGIITKGDIIERLLRKLEIEYHEEEIHRYRASHIFEDIIGDKVALTFQSSVKGKDFSRAGEASSGLKKTLERLGVHPQIVRRAAIASYEAEMNVVIYTDGGTITASVQPDRIRIDVEDTGPGIPDVEKAMQPGFSTASDWVREMGFGAGMGLVNIKKCADKMDLTSSVGEGTHLRIHIDINNAQKHSKAG